MNEGQVSGVGNVMPGMVGGSASNNMNGQNFNTPSGPISPQSVSMQSMQQPMASSGDGDIILNGGKGKSKKKIVIIIILLIGLILIGGIIMSRIITSGGKSNEGNIKELNELISANVDEPQRLLQLVGTIYDSGIPLASFVSSEDNKPDETGDWMNRALNSLEIIQNRLNEGPVIHGVIDQIDVEANYVGLRDALNRDIDKYKRIVTFTIDAMKAFKGGYDLTPETLSEKYGVSKLAWTVDNYNKEMEKVMEDYKANDCGRNQNELCVNLSNNYSRLQNSLSNTDEVRAAYKIVVGDLVSEGEGSVEFYLTNLEYALGVDGNE